MSAEVAGRPVEVLVLSFSATHGLDLPLPEAER